MSKRNKIINCEWCVQINHMYNFFPLSMQLLFMNLTLRFYREGKKRTGLKNGVNIYSVGCNLKRVGKKKKIESHL